MNTHGQARLALVVEDEEVQREMLADLLSSEGWAVTAVADVAEAKRALSGELFDVVVVDYHLPDGTGVEIICTAAAQTPSPACVLLTAYATIPLAVEAMRSGAHDIQTKPVAADLLLASVRRGLAHRNLTAANVNLRTRLQAVLSEPGVVAESQAMQSVLRQVERVAASQATVLITGESGVGKEVVANLIHDQSPRKGGSFVAVHCAALPSTLLEAELFGHVKGAFTGATETRIGRVEEAEGGTLFLDELGEIPLEMQVKLLRVLQERQIVRVGENTVRDVDVRVIAATNRILEEEVEAGRFREDLYYRVNVFPLRVPPLRERPEDIVPLAGLFLAEIAQRDGEGLRSLSDKAQALLRASELPGNVRQLRNWIEAASLLATEPVLTADDFPTAPGSGARTGPVESGSLPDAVEQLEREWIERALLRAEGVRAHAAAALGIPPRVLRYKLRKYGMDTVRPRTGD